ncbi:hypothetical protein M23134_05998 [Microscilla marina ATCC 23134]|uniref:Uncharacterized protein n=1 Tax=Microscilla marina ATCC 23134 TaxID=313606 RepID=A1ZU12_MICM2|nr:hypothetical protein M23134_05998 [Microscilla marina ATCC 23134]
MGTKTLPWLPKIILSFRAIVQIIVITGFGWLFRKNKSNA